MARQFLDIPEAQDLALQALYTDTDGASWTDNTGWSGATAADAYGVTVSGGVVTAIDLTSNNLANVLNETDTLAILNGLPDMTSLKLYQNTNFGLTFSIADNNTITKLYVYSTASTITGSIADNSTLVYLLAYNSSSVITGSIADNSTLTILYVSGTPSVITGSIADNNTLAQLYVYDSSSVITGSIADNSTLLYLRVNNSSSVITGGSSTLASYAYRDIRINNNAYTTAEINEILDAIYRLRDRFTNGAPSLNISGNAAPFGHVVPRGTPVSPGEKLYDLVNDYNSEGFSTWGITYDDQPAANETGTVLDIGRMVATGTFTATMTAGSADLDSSAFDLTALSDSTYLFAVDTSGRRATGYKLSDGAGTTINIKSTAGGTTQNWAVVDASFDNTNISYIVVFEQPNSVTDSPQPADGSTVASETSQELALQWATPGGGTMSVQPKQGDGTNIGSAQTGVLSGTVVTQDYSGLVEGQTYDWKMTADDGTAVTSGTFEFVNDPFESVVGSVNIKYSYPPNFDGFYANTNIGNKRVKINFSGLSDGTAETGEIKVNISELQHTDGGIPKKLIVEDIDYEIHGETVTLKWGTDEIIAYLNGVAEEKDIGHMNYTKEGGLVPQKEDQDITLSTTNQDAGDSYDITMGLRLKA